MKLPAYNEIPDVGLYLEQVSKYLNAYLDEEFKLTPTMITNYVKLKIVPKAIKKAYSREQIALFFIVAISKSVLSMDQIRKILSLRENIEALYNSFSAALNKERCRDELVDKVVKTIRYKIELNELIEKL
ncbi:MAG: DUF1836 domain-containing protein [Erysipelotrichaceae bacterium]|nr:DUF1836 domain-containing protein [Erysipelotrichaceae bacterium]